MTKFKRYKEYAKRHEHANAKMHFVAILKMKLNGHWLQWTHDHAHEQKSACTIFLSLIRRYERPWNPFLVLGIILANFLKCFGTSSPHPCLAFRNTSFSSHPFSSSSCLFLRAAQPTRAPGRLGIEPGNLS
jgi:hypothetical protein